MLRRIMTLAAVFLSLSLAGSAPALAQKIITGPIASNTTLNTVGGRVYQVTGSVTVNAGVTLTINPGVTLKFSPNTYLRVVGTLFAEGGSTPDSTIVFTSRKDDAAPLGAGEDTNGDGAATTPAVGDWAYLSFDQASSSASSLRWCVVRYTGSSNYSSVYMENSAAPTIRACDLSYGYRGIDVRTGAAPTIRNTAINRMTLVPIYQSINSDPVYQNIILAVPSGNGTNAIHLMDGTVSGTARLSRPSATIGGVPVHSLAYQVSTTINIGTGKSLDIAPGVVLKFNGGQAIDNYGLLTARGGATSDSLIYFTGIDDDNAPAPIGQDTNLNGNNTFPSWSNWGGIRFHGASDDNSILRSCRVLFAGYNSTSYGAIYCENASPTLRNCDLTAAYYGIKCIGVSRPVLRNSSINAMQDVPVAIEISSDPVFDSVVFGSSIDNGFDAIGILGGTLAGTNTLRIRGATLGATPIANLVYILLSNITVAAGGNLKIDPGVVAKPRSGVSLIVNGALAMNGKSNPDSLIIFTSYKDDNIGNPADTNNDGSNTSPATGDWGQIKFNQGSTGSVSYAVAKFGGYSNGALISASSTSPTLSNLVLQNSYYGIEQAGTAASVISNVDISNTTYTPVLISISSNPTFSNITFTNVGLSAIGLIPETVGVDSVLRIRTIAGFSNITYHLAGDIVVNTGTRFRVEPGIVLKFSGYYDDLEINGSLRAVGTVDSTIVFTSVHDDSRGNPVDTAGNGAATLPASGNWGKIKFGPTSDDLTAIVQRCRLTYGSGSYPTPAAAIWCNSSSPTIRDNYFATNYIGVWTDGNSAPLIQDNTFFNHGVTPLATSVVASPVYVNNTFDQNGIHAVGLIDETLAADATLEKIVNMGLPSYPYYNLGTTKVGVGTTLTVEPGVIVKARAGSDIFHVSGALRAVGTVGDRIILTTITDDSAGGDSNVDGAATSPVAGSWNGLRFEDSSNDAACLVQHCLLRFGGSSWLVYLDSSGPTLRNNEFELCGNGIEMRNSSAPVIQNNLFRVLTWLPIKKSILSQPVFGGNVLDNVPYQCIGIIGENIGQDMTLRKLDFAGFTNITQVLVGGTLTVQLGATLTIEPGVIFKMLQGYFGGPFQSTINVYGSLVADATPSTPIVLTSLYDDSVGNPADTNGDGAGSVPAAGHWNWIYFDEVSNDATAILDNCQLRYGTSSASYGMVHCNSASPRVSNCRLETAAYALSTRGTSSPLFTNCIVDKMSVAPVLMSLTSNPQFAGNQFLAGNAYNALGIIGETLAQDATIRARNVAQTARIPYLLMGNLTAGFSSILRIEPGVIIKSAQNYSITIQRGFIAEGGAAADSLIVFTSATDDFYGGDTNNDGGLTTAGSTRWGRIIIQNEAIDDSTRISNAVFRYGYNNSSTGTIEINSANPEIDNCLFAYNGIAIDYKGVAGDPAQGWIHNSDFESNTYYGVRNQGTAFTVDATNNWWGHATGPLDNSNDIATGGYFNPGGLGDPVSNKVNYGGWDTDGVQNILLGDVSRNGDVRAYDASLVLQELVAPGLLGPLQKVLGDVDCNGSLMALDASSILRFVAGMDTYFPCALDSVPTKSQGPLPAIMTAAPVSFTAALPPVSLGAGESAWVPVQLAGTGDVFGQEYHIIFSSDQVTVAGVRLLPTAQGSAIAWNVLDGRELRIAIASLEPLGVIDAVEFQLVGAAGLPAPVPVALMLAFVRLNDVAFVEPSAVGDLPGAMVTTLSQNQPNPFNPQTTIRFAVGAGLGEVPVRLMVFDARGLLVRTLVDERRGAGPYEAVWDGRDDDGRRSGSGVYLYRLEVGGESLVNKMILLK